MAQAEGIQSQIFIQEEATYGSDPTPGGYLLPIVSEDVRTTEKLIESKLIRSSRNPSRPGRGNQSVDGNIVTELIAELGYFWKWALGSVTDSGSGPYTHIFKIDNTLASFVLEKGFTDISQYFKFNGCKLGGFSLDVDSEGISQITFPVMGQKETVGSSPLDSTPVEYDPTIFDSFDIGTIEEGGASIAIVTSIRGLTFDNALSGDNYVINPSALGIRTGIGTDIAKVKGTITASFENVTLYNKAVNGTESSLKLIWSKGDGLGSAGNESLEFFIPELRYERATPIIPGAVPLIVELGFVGYYENHADASALEITLKNATASY